MQESLQVINDTKQSNDLYVPSSSEKKRAMLMYVFFGLIVSMSKKELSVFEYFHLKQALWRSVLFVIFLILGFVLVFLPLLKYIWLMLILVIVVCWVMFISNAWKWSYKNKEDKSPIMLFSAIWWWFINLFEINIKIYPDQDKIQEIESLQDLVK